MYLFFFVLHVKWNSLKDIVHGNVIADYSGLTRRLVVSFDISTEYKQTKKLNYNIYY